MSVLAVIPARFGSTRFPGKPLASETGKPLIQHVVERVRESRGVDLIVVATDDERIAAAARGFGCDVCMTRTSHPNGASRIAEVVSRLGDGSFRPRGWDGEAGVGDLEMVVNVQGDEPLIEPAAIDALIAGLRTDAGAPMATLASRFFEGEDPTDANIVKLVVDRRGRAMYFSRSLIPFVRAGGEACEPLKHPGLYAYRPGFLAEYVSLSPTPCEQSEQLEQLRVLEHGYSIAVVRFDTAHHGIDTPAQYAAFVAMMRGG